MLTLYGIAKELGGLKSSHYQTIKRSY